MTPPPAAISQLITEIVDAMPPLTADQRAALAAALRPSRLPAADASQPANGRGSAS